MPQYSSSINIVTNTDYYSNRISVYETSKTTDRYLITKSWDTFISNRDSILSSIIYDNTTRKIVQNYNPITAKEYRYIYQKSPHEFTTYRYFTFGLKIPPNSIRKLIINICPEAITDKYILTGTSFIPITERIVYLQLERQPLLQILKYPDYFRWNLLPRYIENLTFHIRQYNDVEIDWNSLKLIVRENGITKFVFNKKDFEISKLNDNYQSIFKVRLLRDFNLQSNSQVSILVYLIDEQGNYISDILY